MPYYANYLNAADRIAVYGGRVRQGGSVYRLPMIYPVFARRRAESRRRYSYAHFSRVGRLNTPPRQTDYRPPYTAGPTYDPK